MKWALIGIVALVVLGGAGYAVYTLTDAPEQAQEWWDEKKLDNFEVLANRELDDFEKKVADHEATLLKMKKDRIMWAGHEDYGSNDKEQETGFMTLLGYEMQTAYRTAQGEAIAAAYKKASQGDGTVINAETGEADLPEDMLITVELPSKDGTVGTKEMKPADVFAYLGQIEEELITLEADKKRGAGVVKEYDESIAAWNDIISQEKDQLKELRKQVKMIASEIKIQKAKEDLAELNKAINGESSDSELGKLIHGYEKRKSSFERDSLVAADEKAKSGGVSLSDLDAPSKTTAPKKSRFLK